MFTSVCYAEHNKSMKKNIIDYVNQFRNVINSKYNFPYLERSIVELAWKYERMQAKRSQSKWLFPKSILKTCEAKSGTFFCA